MAVASSSATHGGKRSSFASNPAARFTQQHQIGTVFDSASGKRPPAPRRVDQEGAVMRHHNAQEVQIKSAQRKRPLPAVAVRRLEAGHVLCMSVPAACPGVRHDREREFCRELPHEGRVSAIDRSRCAACRSHRTRAPAAGRRRQRGRRRRVYSFDKCRTAARTACKFFKASNAWRVQGVASLEIAAAARRGRRLMSGRGPTELAFALA